MDNKICDICEKLMRLNRSFSLPCWECENTECPNYVNSDIRKLSGIVDAIQNEKNFQQAKHGDKPISLEGYLVLLQGELDEAMQAWRKNKTNDDCLREVLQVATLAVRAMKAHGIVEREEFSSK